VRFIYKQFLEGYSVHQIAEMLTENKIPTVKGKEIWSCSTVRNILQNERYCGDVLMQKTVTVDCLSHRSVKNTGQEKQYRMTNHHPAIISKEDWYIVQEMLKYRRYMRRKDGSVRKRIQLHYIEEGILQGFFILSMQWDGYDMHKIFEKF